MSTFEESQGHPISSAGARRLQERLKNDQLFFTLARDLPSLAVYRHTLFLTTYTLSTTQQTLSLVLSLSLSLSLTHTHT